MTIHPLIFRANGYLVGLFVGVLAAAQIMFGAPSIFGSAPFLFLLASILAGLSFDASDVVSNERAAPLLAGVSLLVMLGGGVLASNHLLAQFF